MKINNERSNLCETCHKPHDNTYGSGRFCCVSCARQYASKINNETRSKKIRELWKNKPLHSKPCRKCGSIVQTKFDGKNILCDNCKKKGSILKHCKICGALKKTCKRPDICKKHQLFPALAKYFGFNLSVIGSIDVYDEFVRIQNLINEDYYDKNLSVPELQIKYDHNNNGNFLKILKALGIKIRTLSQGCSVSYLTGRQSPKNDQSFYKHGWHTTWNNKKVFLRSSYELDYAKELDCKMIDYEVEKLRVLYFDTQLQKQRVAIPDFYLPESNEIIEIKSSYTLNEQNMKDKFKSYIEHGYKPKVILNHTEINFMPS